MSNEASTPSQNVKRLSTVAWVLAGAGAIAALLKMAGDSFGTTPGKK